MQLSLADKYVMRSTGNVLTNAKTLRVDHHIYVNVYGVGGVGGGLLFRVSQKYNSHPPTSDNIPFNPNAKK